MCPPLNCELVAASPDSEGAKLVAATIVLNAVILPRMGEVWCDFACSTVSFFHFSSYVAFPNDCAV